MSLQTLTAPPHCNVSADYHCSTLLQYVVLCVCRLILLHPTVLCGIFLLLHPTVVCGSACPQTHTAPPLCSVWCCTFVCRLLLLHLTVVCLQTLTAPPHCTVWYIYSYCVPRLLLLHPNVMCGIHTLTVSADSYCSTPLYCVVYILLLCLQTLTAPPHCKGGIRTLTVSADS